MALLGKETHRSCMHSACLTPQLPLSSLPNPQEPTSILLPPAASPGVLLAACAHNPHRQHLSLQRCSNPARGLPTPAAGCRGSQPGVSSCSHRQQQQQNVQGPVVGTEQALVTALPSVFRASDVSCIQGRY